jgi:hypothetical protein
MKKELRAFLTFWMANVAFVSSAQVSISGPTCVNPRVIYQYVITGSWDSTTTMQICITGGVIANTADSCTPGGPPQSSIQIAWSAGVSGSIMVHSSKGDSSLSVTLTDTLSGGAIVDSTASQQIPYLATPSIVLCSASSGGSCTPTYNYQWQQSPDLLTWVDIPQATFQNLPFSGQLQQSTFFRRKVTETNSNTIAYSGVAVINVSAPPPTASAQ